MRPALTVFGLLAAAELLTPQRWWLERLAFVVPGPRKPLAGVPRALGGGFIALNALGLALTDFYLGLAAFHLGVGLTTSLCARRWRWLGVALIVLALVLGALT